MPRRKAEEADTGDPLQLRLACRARSVAPYDQEKAERRYHRIPKAAREEFRIETPRLRGMLPIHAPAEVAGPLLGRKTGQQDKGSKMTREGKKAMKP